MEHSQEGWRSATAQIRESVYSAGSLRDCSKATDIALSTLSRKLNGNDAFNLSELWRIAAYLNKSPTSLVEIQEKT